MPAKPSQRRTAALLLSSLAVLTACTACTHALPDEDLPRHRRNDRAPHSPAVGDAAEVRVEGRGDHFELISTSSQNKAPPEDKVASSDLPAADKQYDYPLVRPVYAPFVTRPSSYAVPYVEILDHHRDPPFSKPSHFVTGSPMVSTVVVQDMSQTPLRPHEEVTSLVDNFQHLGPTKIPFTDVQVVTRPIGGADKKPNFTDKLEETSLEHGGGGDSDEDLEEDDDDDDDNEELLENPPNLDLGGIVEDVVRKVFQENPVLHDAAELAPRPEIGVKTWPCPPVTCCTRPASKTKDAKDAKQAKQAKQAKRRCSTFVNCVAGRSPGCPLRAERVPQALALTTPSNGYSNTTGPKADVRVGEPQPRFKKKKILKKKKKLLKKFLLPLLLAYKLLFLMVVPMMVNGMMMMMSSSGMAGFFFALIGASITMVRVYNGAMKAPPPPPNKVVKVIKYVQTVAPPTASPAPTPAPTLPTVIHHQPYVEEHFPTYHPPHHPPHHAPTYGSYYPPPYWTRNYDRSEGALDGGRKKRRRTDEQLGTGVLFSSGDNQLWLV